MGKTGSKARVKGRRVSSATKRTTKAKPRRVAKRARLAAKPATQRATPRVDPIRELAKKIVDLTVTNNDEGAFALYADNVISREMGQPPMTGIDAIKQKFAMWRGMVSDSTFRAANVWVDGNTIVIEWDGRVTLAPSGRVVNLQEIAIHEIEGGKIARERFYYDPAVLRQE
jgi:ketosteroid isomerase-like protein